MNTGQLQGIENSPCLYTIQDNIRGCSHREQFLNALNMPNSPRSGTERMKQPQTSYVDVHQHASSGGACVIEDMSMGNDGQQILVSTTGEPVRVQRMTAGSRTMQFVGSVSDETFQLYL
ncbi:hypothetical protein B0J13DRAFT_533066 [Dactylonectria estremocensis]|uniref:Uncharacterized protein n=1 Tax=Dactylonectria estremocensis TaxID=1079267 RepID=A0A9P9DE11_9HYPO|nr:hypothetical protein B0J13DRAFT_533066 [Dactylonectria estremocensis]